MTVRGSCLCGGIRFRVEAPLAPIQVCHCGACRKAQGGPFATNSPVATAAFHLEAGAELLQAYESSPGKERVFCRRCGSPVYSRLAAKPELLRLRIGLVDPPVAARPVWHAFCGSRADWWPAPDDGLPCFEGVATPR